MEVDFFHLSQWPTTVSSDPCVCVCVCEWGCILMHALVCCQLAECRPWRLCCSMTCTNMEKTKIPFITISLCVCPSSFSLSLSLPQCLSLNVSWSVCMYFVCLFHTDYQSVCVYPWAFSLSFPIHASHLYFYLLSNTVFSDITVRQFLIHYFIFVICLLALSPCLM